MKTISCILLVCLLGLLTYADETQEQQVERLIRELQDEDSNVRGSAALALGQIGSKDAVSALIQALQDQNQEVRATAAGALARIGTPEALKAVKEYQSRQ